MTPNQKHCEEDDQQVALPRLRQDITILPSQTFWNGAPSWLLHDAINNKYFRIGRFELFLLQNWSIASAKDLAAKATSKFSKPYEVAEIEEFAKFLIKNRLTDLMAQDDWRGLLDQRDASKQAVWKKTVHSYLFFRIPLFNPQRILNILWPFLAFLFTRPSAVIFSLFGLASVFIVSRQWEAFQATFVSFLTLKGFLLYGASLIFIKIIHEFGHAFMATKYKVEVPIIGAALIVLMPILYTDTTGAHRLQSRRERLNIDLGGIYAELGLAVIATLFWIFLPDGNLRSIAFATATLSWVISLAVNLNPFMRFDGYYILSDFFGFENLQDRGFAFGRWRLREILFDLKAPPPEALPRSWHWPLVLHAWGTWIYRFFLFLGIALIVYAFFIKLVGIFLFIIEIIWFIAAPVWREIKFWWSIRSDIMKSKRKYTSAAIVLGAIALFFFPFKTTIEIPSVLRTADSYALFAPQDAKVIETQLKSGREVVTGEALAVLTSPELEEQASQLKYQVDLSMARLARASSDAEERSLRLIIEQELEAQIGKLRQITDKREALTLRAPIDGVLLDIDPQFTSGIWINSKQQIGLIGAQRDIEITGYVEEASAFYLEDFQLGKFIPNALQIPKLDVRISMISVIPIDTMDELMLADIYGGQIPINSEKEDDRQQGLSPVGSWYKVKFSFGNDSEALPVFKDQIISGIIRLKGKRQSYAARIGKQIVGVLVREFAP